MRSSRWVDGSRRSTRARRTSRRDSGSWSGSAPLCTAPRISSTRNALPSERSWTWSTSRALGGAPRMASSCRATSARPRRSSSMRCTARTRSQPVTSGRSGWLRCSSSVRKLTTTSTRSACSARTSRATRSSVDRSAQCRSSITNMSGRSAASRSITPTTSSSRRAVPPSTERRRAAARCPDRGRAARCASSERAGPMKRVELLGGRVAHERAEHVRERAERQALAAHLDAAAREDPRARRARALGRLLDEPRLAHAGLAARGARPRGPPRPQRRAPPSALPARRPAR